MALSDKHTECAQCGMVCAPNEYHPYAACLMFMACKDGPYVRAKLDEVRKQDDALILQLVEALENSHATLWEEEDDPSRPAHAAITAARARLESKP